MTDLKITSSSEHLRMSRTYLVENADPIKLYPFSEKLIVPDRIVVNTCNGVEDGVAIYGGQLLKDGTTSDLEREVRLPYKRAEWPQWVNDLVAEAERDALVRFPHLRRDTP